MKKAKYKPLYADIKEEIEKATSMNDSENIGEEPEDQISEDIISKILTYRKMAKWLFITAYIPVIICIIIKSAGHQASISFIIFVVLMYVLGIWGSIISIKLYRAMQCRYEYLALILALACPAISIWYIIEFSKDSREYLINKCTEKTFKNLKI